MVGFGGIDQFLLRNGTYLNITGDWTISGWASQGATTPIGGRFRNYWSWGDNNYVNPYIYLGSSLDSNNIQLEYFDGVNYIDTAAYNPVVDSYFYWSIRYDSTLHTLDFIVNASADPNVVGTIIGSLTIDLSTITFSIKEEIVGGSWNDFKFGYVAVYQTNWSLTTLKFNRTSSDFNAAGFFRRSFTRLQSAQSLNDTTGAGHNWTLTGILPYPTPIGTIIYEDDFDSGQKEIWANWRTFPVVGDAILTDGGCTAHGFMYACTAAFIQQEISPNPFLLNIKVQMGALVGSSVTDLINWEISANFSDGIGLFLVLNGNGSFNLRMNEVTSGITSGPNLFPNNGALFALQWRLSYQNNHSVAVQIDINNITVWTVNYDWSFASPSTTTGTFSSFTVNPLFLSNIDPTLATQLFFDNIEVNNVDTKVSWLPCGSFTYPTCWVPPPPPPPPDLSLAGMYYLKPGKTNDTYFTDLELQTKQDFKIPDPYADTALLGDE